MGFVFMIAEEAARFANEKGLDDEFTLVPEFVGTLMNAEEKDGRMEISGNVFISDDKSACISVQYQKNGRRETYNLLVTDIESKDRISYAGEINGPAETRKDQKEERNGGDGEKPAGTGAPNWVSYAGETNGPKNADKEKSAGTSAPNLSSLVMIIMIVSLSMIIMIMWKGKDYTAGKTLSNTAIAIKIIGTIMVLRGIVGLDIYHNAEDKDEMIASVKTLFIGILI
jgi:hypothetical protein